MPGANIDPQSLPLYTDEALLVVNKPAGLLVLPDGYDPQLPHLKGILEPTFGRLWIVHRLDKETSGVLALARSADAHRFLNDQFAAHQVKKCYHALVHGTPDWEQRTVRLPLRSDGDRHHRTVVDRQRGKYAVTHFQIVQRFRAYTLLEAQPETGRTHQIRAHLATIGLPCTVDKLYGNGKPLYLSSMAPDYRAGNLPERPLLERLGLHAFQLELTHPLSGEIQRFEAPHPGDLESTLLILRKYR